MNASWLEAALEPPRAHAAPLGRGRLRAVPEDFLVEEELGFEPAGSGQHVLLKVRKREANTQWVAGELAGACGCRPADVGYAGLKDRHAIAIQWFSVPPSRLTPEAWRGVSGPDFEVLEAHAHSRKLPRGALKGNRFEVRIRDAGVDSGQLAARMREIERRGVPDYFGPQRFGRDANNLRRIEGGLRALRGAQRGFVLSAARSLVFNAVLAARVAEGTWCNLEPGDIANLDGRGSIFPVESVDAGLVDRCARLDIHPTGPMWGRGAPQSRGRIGELESRVAGEFAQACTLVEQAGMEPERRSLRLAVRDLQWTYEPPALVIRFRLSRGGFATTVLREIIDAHGLDGDDAG
jgi:tRNA pseudouridine13 synthase